MKLQGNDRYLHEISELTIVPTPSTEDQVLCQEVDDEVVATANKKVVQFGDSARMALSAIASMPSSARINAGTGSEIDAIDNNEGQARNKEFARAGAMATMAEVRPVGECSDHLRNNRHDAIAEHGVAVGEVGLDQDDVVARVGR